MASDADKAFNESMRRIMGPGWKPSPSVGTKPRTQRAKTYSNKDNKKGNMKRAAPKAVAPKAVAPKQPSALDKGGSAYHKTKAYSKEQDALSDMSRLDKYGRPTHYKDGSVRLRWR